MCWILMMLQKFLHLVDDHSELSTPRNVVNVEYDKLVASEG